jgi:hypothetical protein
MNEPRVAISACLAPRPALMGTLGGVLRFISGKISELLMYPWPLGEYDNAMDVALEIAMDYLDRTGQAVRFNEVQSTAAMAIAVAWKVGVRHPIKLADVAIKSVESKEPKEV